MMTAVGQFSMPSDVDETKEACILTWISSILQKESIAVADLTDGIIFLDLLCLTKDFIVDVSKLDRPIDRFCRIEEILDEFFHTSSVRFVNYEEILQPSDGSSHYNVIACALLILTVGLQSKNSVLFMKSAQKLKDDHHQEVVTLTEELVKVDTTNPLTSEMLRVLKQASGGMNIHERECSTPIIPSHPPFGFTDSPLGPLQTLLQSPQIIQKSRLREKDMEIRRLRNALEKERKARAELEGELNESQRRVHCQEQKLEEAAARMRSAQREGRDLREEAENAVGYRQRAESAETERDRLRGRLERLQSISSRNKALEEEVKELHSERVSLRHQLESYAGVETRAHQLTRMELEMTELRDNLAKATSEIALLRQARDLASEEAARASELASELRRQLAEARFASHLDFSYHHRGGESTASTPNTELPPMGEPMSLVHEKRVVELERNLDELRAVSVPRTDYEQLMGDYGHLQVRRQVMSDELAAAKMENDSLRRRLMQLERVLPLERFETLSSTMDGTNSSAGTTDERESADDEEGKAASRQESEEWAKVIVEAVDEVLGEEVTDTVESIAEVTEETAKSSSEASENGVDAEVVMRMPPTEAHLQELRDNRRSLAHEIVELNSQFEELQQQNETLIDEADRMRHVLSDDVFSLREELDVIRDLHTNLEHEFEDYQGKMNTEVRSLADQIKQLIAENSRLRCEKMERDIGGQENGIEMNGHSESQFDLTDNHKLELIAAENSALLQMINNLKDQVKCLLLDPAGGNEHFSMDNEANYICNGSSVRADSPFNEEDILEKLGLIIDEFCSSMCSLAGRMQEDSKKRKEIEDLQQSLNRSLDTNVKLGTALQEANASIIDKESCVNEMKNAKNCLVGEVEKLKLFIRTMETSLESSENEFKQAFDSLTKTAEHLGKVASAKQESILELQGSVSELSEQKEELINRIASLEKQVNHRNSFTDGLCLPNNNDSAVLALSFEDSVRTVVEERNIISAKLVNIENKLEALVGEKEMSDMTNHSLSENVIEMSLENENMAATIKHYQELVEQFTEKVDGINKVVQEKEMELNEAIDGSRLTIQEMEKQAKGRETELKKMRNGAMQEVERLKAENVHALDRIRELEKTLSAKADLCETLATQLKNSETRLKELERVESQLLDVQNHSNIVEKKNSRLEDDILRAEKECSLLRESKKACERETQALREVKNSIERQRVLESEQTRDRLQELTRVKDSEITRLNKEIESSNHTVANLKTELDELRRRIELKESENASLVETQERNNRRYEEISLERKELIDGRDRCYRRTATLQLEIEELHRTIDLQKTELDVVQNNLRTSVASEEAIRARLNAIEREDRTQKSMSNAEEYRSEMANYKKRISTLEERVRFLEEEIGRLEKQAMEWRARANSSEDRNRMLEMQLKRYSESYEVKKVSLKDAYDKLDEETRMKTHFQNKASVFEEEILPLRRRQSELAAENKRLAHRNRSLEVQLEFASRVIKNGSGGGNLNNFRTSLPPPGVDGSLSRVPPFPVDDNSPVHQGNKNSNDYWNSPPSTLSSRTLTTDPLNQTETGRISELQRRNYGQPDHMKTSYPVETQVCDPREVAEILGSSSSTTTVVRHSMTSSLPPNSSAFMCSENFTSSLRPEVISPSRFSSNGSKGRPSSTPLVLQEFNGNCSRLSPVPQRSSTAFEIKNTPKQSAELRLSLRGKRHPRPKSFQLS